MKQKLLEFLKALEAAIPPPANCHHAITFAQYGSDETGWQDKLALQINIDGRFQCWFLEDGDLDGATMWSTIQTVQEDIAEYKLAVDVGSITAG